MGRAITMEHSFYCIKCGNKGIPLPRKLGRQREKFHRKKMYCIFCKEVVNHIECRTYAEVEQFKIDFEEGVFKDETEESIKHTRE